MTRLTRLIAAATLGLAVAGTATSHAMSPADAGAASVIAKKKTKGSSGSSPVSGLDLGSGR